MKKINKKRAILKKSRVIKAVLTASSIKTSPVKASSTVQTPRNKWGNLMSNILASTVIFKDKSTSYQVDYNDKLFTPKLSFPEMLQKVRELLPPEQLTKRPERKVVTTISSVFKPVEAAPVKTFKPDGIRVQINSDPEGLTDLLVGEKHFWKSPYTVDLKKIKYDKYQLDRPKSKREKIEEALSVALGSFNRPKPESRLVSQPTAENPTHFQPKIDMLPAFGHVAKLFKTNPTARTASFSGLPVENLAAVKTTGFKSLVSFAVVAAVVGVPFLAIGYYQNFQKGHGQVLSAALTTFKSSDVPVLEGVQEPANFDLLKSDLSDTSDYLSQVTRQLPKYSAGLASGYYLVKGATAIAQASPILKTGLSQILSDAKMGQKDTKHLVPDLRIFVDSLIQASPLINQAGDNLKKVSASFLPTEFQSKFSQVQELLPVMQKSLSRVLMVADSLLEILGEKEQKRYLVVFENNSEMRATGGFMGSLALMDVYQGKIKNLEIPQGGPYDFKGSLLARVISPQPLHLVNPVWQMQDANWFFDWPTSAKKIIWFYQKSGGPSVDGVIALNTFVLRDLLKVTGPVDLPEYGKTIDENDFLMELQKSVEKEYKDIKKPKAIISELAPKV
ncbi:DUF4012 domain-containing protein, partial [Candidatus Uhrbacteria bacterium]|nr:DUF4012 domain-containing protein [Candidatus Uhrbacteria bacterium]